MLYSAGLEVAAESSGLIRDVRCHNLMVSQVRKSVQVLICMADARAHVRREKVNFMLQLNSSRRVCNNFLRTAGAAMADPTVIAAKFS